VPDIASRRPVATSRGFATLRGLGTAGSGRVWVSARPPAVRHEPGWSSCGPRRMQPKPLSGPPCAYVPLQRSSPYSPAPRRHLTDPKTEKTTRPAMLPLLGFRALRHTLGPADPHEWQRIPPPPRATCEVWLPPSRPPPPALPARKAPERPWASPFKAFPSAREVPLSEPFPS
jgi:hypothetical protein